MYCSLKMNLAKLILNIFYLTYLVNAISQESQPSERYRRMTSDIGRSCLIPQYPLHTKYVVFGDDEEYFQVGYYVPHQNLLQTICDKGYKLKPFERDSSFCLNGTWVDPLTRCLRACSPLVSTDSTNVTCSFENKDMTDCYNPVEGTSAKLECFPLYEEGSIEQYPVRECIDGKWDRAIIDCSPICGLQRPIGLPLMINGTNVTRGDYPWQVGLYNATTMELFCGGSVIDGRIILTAAHCMCDYTGHAYPKEAFLVAAGKYYRKYYDERDIDAAQYSKILSIHVPEKYKSSISRMANDIAILILENPLNITENVQPICIELYRRSKNLELSPDVNFTVLGWGYTRPGKDLADELKKIIVPYIPFKTCYENIIPAFKPFITDDKICAGYSNSSMSVCSGDSGGGLHLQNKATYRYFIQGIVSSSPRTDNDSCDANQYSTYTSVYHHREFLQKIIAYHKIYQTVVCDDDDCSNTQRKLPICTDKIREYCRNITTCKIPEYPRHAKLEVIDNWASVSSATPGDKAQVDNKLKTVCTDDYYLKKELNVEFDLPKCMSDGNWTSKPTPCVKCRFPLQNERHWGMLVLLSSSALNIQSNPVGQLVANTLANLKTCSDE